MRSDLATIGYIIVAKFLTKRALNMDAIAATFQPLWRSKNGFRLKNLGNHIILFIFYSKADVDNILANEPWSYDKNLMVLQRYEVDSEVKTCPLIWLIFGFKCMVFRLGSWTKEWQRVYMRQRVRYAIYRMLLQRTGEVLWGSRCLWIFPNPCVRDEW